MEISCRIAGLRHPGNPTPIPPNIRQPPSHLPEGFIGRLPAPVVWRKHSEPDWARRHRDLQTHKNLTLQLVWQEERESHPEGYGYSRFCDLYRRWLKQLDLVLRQEHRAGEKLFVDYAGDTIPIQDARTGDILQTAPSIRIARIGALPKSGRKWQEMAGF